MLHLPSQSRCADRLLLSGVSASASVHAQHDSYSTQIAQCYVCGENGKLQERTFVMGEKSEYPSRNGR